MGNRFYLGILLIGLNVGLSGCVTPILWEKHAFDGFNEPARPANLQVARCQNDWLVQYHEVNDDSGRVLPRAYFLHANQQRVRAGKAPRFVTGTFATNGEVRAVLSDNGQEFRLYDGHTLVGCYQLPLYPKPSGRVKQVLLTPLTVAADAAIVGTCGALFVGYLWVAAGAPCLN